MSPSCTLKEALFPVGHFLGLWLGCCYNTCLCPATVGDIVLILSSARSKPVGAFPAPLKHPLSPLARKGMWPLRRASHKVTCTGNRHISKEDSRRLDIGCCTLFSFLSTSCRCVFGVTVCIKSSALLSAAVMQPVQTKAISICVYHERF